MDFQDLEDLADFDILGSLVEEGDFGDRDADDLLDLPDLGVGVKGGSSTEEQLCDEEGLD